MEDRSRRSFPRAKVTFVDIETIARRYRSEPAAVIAKDYGISTATVRRCARMVREADQPLGPPVGPEEGGGE